MHEKQDKGMDRRNFLRAVGGASTAAVATAAGSLAATEAQAYDRAVTDWERRRYFERI